MAHAPSSSLRPAHSPENSTPDLQLYTSNHGIPPCSLLSNVSVSPSLIPQQPGNPAGVNILDTIFRAPSAASSTSPRPACACRSTLFAPGQSSRASPLHHAQPSAIITKGGRGRFGYSFDENGLFCVAELDSSPGLEDTRSITSSIEANAGSVPSQSVAQWRDVNDAN